ncbi:MAG: VCBS repeat-containing protein [Proteobacteria bacterium]|nr:VCBS repeat-containing protein [Pseudomonadota bacterium]
MKRFALISISLFFSLSTVLAAVPPSERSALVTLYNVTSGSGWTNHTNWLNGDPCADDWYGVSCTPGENPNVTWILLPSNNLVGRIPTALVNLPMLKFLSLSSNQLSSSIPPVLGNLANLNSLYLSNNQLTGPIPPALGKLNLLETLWLSGNQLSGIIPVELGDLGNLYTLFLSQNQLSGSIPFELGNLTGLDGLYLHDNQLTGSIPVELGKLSVLRNMNLGDNQLTGSIPVELGDLLNLRALGLINNQLTGNIPVELSNLTNLNSLELSSNQLDGTIPVELTELSNLAWLMLDNNQLSGTIPTEIGSMENLGSLALNNNQLSGGIPATLGNLVNLWQLKLENNRLNGVIPAELGKLINLKYLVLKNNHLSGRIPAVLGQLTNLYWLHLSGNMLRGSIPAELMNLSELSNIDLDWNALYTTDNALDVFLDSKSISDWSTTQTIAPVLGNVGGAGTNAVTVTWDSIEYTADPGGYRVWYGTAPGGPYKNGGISANKSSTQHTVTGLNPGQLYYFIVKTETKSNGNNTNIVISDKSTEVFSGDLPPDSLLMPVVRFTSFDDDGKVDVLLRNMTTGRWEINFLNNRWVKSNSGPTWLFPSFDWEMMGTGDFNGNGRGDVLIRNRVTGGWRIFLMNGRAFTSGITLITPNLDWQMAGLGDFDGDGKADVLLRNVNTGRWQIFFINNRWVKANSGPTWLFPSLDWELMGVGDFNANGRDDIIIRNRLTGGWRIFIMNGRNFTSGITLITQDLDWQIAGLDDFDGDAKADVLMRNQLTGRWKIFFINNRWVKANSGSTWLFPSFDWEMMGTGDFNGNGRGDILLRNNQTGGWWMFLMNGRIFTNGKTPITSNQEWMIPY